MPTRRRKSSQMNQRQLNAVAAELQAVANPKTPLELGRRLYEMSPLPIARIAEIIGIHPKSFYRIVRREGWKPRRLAVLHGNDHRFTRRFQFTASGAAKKGLTNAEVARAFASRSPEELAAEREEIVGALWEKAQVEIEKVNESKKRGQERREHREELEDIVLVSRAIESLVRMRKRLRELATEAGTAPARTEEEICAGISAVLEEFQREREGKGGEPPASQPSSAKGVDRDSARQDAD
jgi:hypothetical protein